MLESWLIELAKGVGRFFINPLFYWTILLLILAGHFRIKKERFNFGSRVFDMFTEWKNTWSFSLVFGLLISLITMGVGIVFSYETLILLIVVIFLLSCTLRFSLLSASYTIGLTYILLLFLPYMTSKQSIIGEDISTSINMTGLAILLGLFLLAESLLILRTKPNETYPNLVKGKRGSWIGQHHIKKLTLIPFFALIPGGLIEPIAPYWPMLPIGSGMYGIVLFPFLLSFDYKVTSNLPIKASKQIGKRILLLSLIVIGLALISLYSVWISLASVLVAFIGKEYIMYRERLLSKHVTPYFYQEDHGLKVMSVIPGTPANRLNILVGERIIKVNNHTVHSIDDFYEALQNSGSFFKIDILDDDGEIRFIKSAFYEGEHHKLGLIFTTTPYFKK